MKNQVDKYLKLIKVENALNPSALPDNSIDLTVTSPPYNLGKSYSVSSSDNLTYSEYLSFTEKYLFNLFN